eukprot:scaffold34685_cov183-Amphora_coffeaeformis.AAC.23
MWKGGATTATTADTCTTSVDKSQEDLKKPAMMEATREDSLRELFQAVECLPAEKTAAFWEACDICPDIVDSESDGMLFLRFENFNIWKAAEGIAEYWNTRRRLFGDRAHLPLTQTGKGALTQNDALSVQSGTVAILPKTNDGQSVVVADRGRSLLQATEESKLRAAFYILSILSHKEHAQTKGILVLSMLVTPRVARLDHSFVTKAIKICKCFPMTLHLHLLNSFPKTQTARSIVAHQVFAAGMAFASLYFGHFQIITETTGHDILRKLRSMGLQTNGIPVALGGEWTYEKFNKWCREQIGREQLRDHSNLPVVAAVSAAAAAATTTSTFATGSPSVRVKTEDVSMENEKKRDRIRRLNVIHSRQKRERRKAEQAQLQSQYEVLLKKQHELQAESRKLEALLRKAHELVKEYERRNR